MGVVLILAINRKKKQVFALRAVREEKIFKFVTLAVFDIAACIALSYFLSIPMETNQLSVQAILHVATSSAATAATFLALFLLIPRLKVFCESFSWVLNYVLLAILVGMGWGVAWLLSVLLCGPDGSSQVTQAVYAQQIFRFAVIAVFLAGLTLILVKNGMRLSGGKVAMRTAARRGQKLLGAEQMVENRELRAEVSELKKEVAGLKDELAGRKENEGENELVGKRENKVEDGLAGRKEAEGEDESAKKTEVAKKKDSKNRANHNTSKRSKKKKTKET